MPVRIRLQRHGKKGKPFYWVVAADARAKRDGRYLEKIGTYNPNTNPATIDLNVDSAVQWLQNGAQPTDTARNILSYTGVLLKNHLLKGVHKGALSQEDADAKFEAWVAEKESKIAAKISSLGKEAEAAKKKALAAEKEANEKRKAEAEALLAAEEEAAKAEEAPADEVAAEAAPEVEEEAAPAEEVVAEAAPEAEEAPVEEVAAEVAPEAEEAPEEKEEK
jgi:small subunit ribosomal protein S16